MLASLLLAIVAVLEQGVVIVRWLMGEQTRPALVLDLGDDWGSIGRLLLQSLFPILLAALVGALAEVTSTLRSAVQASQSADLARAREPSTASVEGT